MNESIKETFHHTIVPLFSVQSLTCFLSCRNLLAIGADSIYLDQRFPFDSDRSEFHLNSVSLRCCRIFCHLSLHRPNSIDELFLRCCFNQEEKKLTERPRDSIGLSSTSDRNWIIWQKRNLRKTVKESADKFVSKKKIGWINKFYNSKKQTRTKDKSWSAFACELMATTAKVLRTVDFTESSKRRSYRPSFFQRLNKSLDPCRNLPSFAAVRTMALKWLLIHNLSLSLSLSFGTGRKGGGGWSKGGGKRRVTTAPVDCRSASESVLRAGRLYIRCRRLRRKGLPTALPGLISTRPINQAAGHEIPPYIFG